MVNKKGGKNKKKGKRNRTSVQHQKLTTRTEDQQYGVITKMLGDCRVNVKFIDDSERLVETMGIIRGKLRRRVWMNVGNVVLVAQRDYDKKVDIIDKYSDDNVRKLKRMGEIHKLLLDFDGPDDKADDGFNFFGETEDDKVEEPKEVKREAVEVLNDIDKLNEENPEFNWDEL